MKSSRRGKAAAALLGILAGCGSNRSADLVLLNGAIHPRAGDTVTVEALAVRDGLIVRGPNRRSGSRPG